MYNVGAHMSDPYQKALRRGCLGGLLWQLVAALAALVFVGLFFAVMLTSTLLPVEPWLQSALGGGLILLFLFGFVAATFAFALSRARVLDPAFAALGIRGRALGLNGRQYHGSVRGRRLDATYFRGARGSLGPVLEVHVECRVMTKLALGTRTGAGTFLGGLLGLTELRLPDADYARFVASASEPEFATALLSNPRVKAELLALLVDPRDEEMRTFSLRPGVVSFTRRFFDAGALSGAELRRTSDALLALAELAEASPAPRVVEAPSALEQSLRQSPGRAGCLIAGALIALAVVIGVATVAGVVYVDSASQNAPSPKKPGSGRRR